VEAAKVATSEKKQEKVTLNAGASSPEEVQRFQQRLAELREVGEDEEAAARARLVTPREAQFALDLALMFEQALWITEGVGFPNGLPLNQQNPVKARIWWMFVNAIRAVQNGSAQKKKGDPDGRPPDNGTA
jgi:hypothetical protein